MENRIGKDIKCLSNQIKRQVINLESIKKLDKISGANSYILSYIYNRGDIPTYQKDLEKEFNITRSTASNIIKLMEQKEMLYRESVDKDQRLKKLVLSDFAKEICEEISKEINSFEKSLLKDISDEEINVFKKVLEKISKNINERC